MNREERHFSPEQLQAVEDAVRNLLEALGEDVTRPGLVDTPNRVARMYDEVFEGMRFSNKEIADMFGKCFDEPDAKDLVLIDGIDAFSYCEHHMALMYNMKISVAYLPNGRVIGLSKVPRIVDMVCKRLQLQERIGSDIADILEMILRTNDIMVVIEGEHSCMTARGIKKPGVSTKTSVVRGDFAVDPDLRAEVYSLLK